MTLSDKKKTKTVSFRLTENEYSRLLSVANECNITVTRLLFDLTEDHILESYIKYRKELAKKKFMYDEIGLSQQEKHKEDNE